MKCRSSLILAVLALSVSFARAAEPTTKPATDNRVLIISIDGLRPDLMLRANTPTLHRLLEEGSFTLWAQTTAVSVTMPSHVSMLTGAKPQVHQIEWNHDMPLSQPIYPKVPTLFELAKKAGYTTGMVAGKSKFEVLAKPGTLDVGFAPTSEVITDREVLSHALDVINAGTPQVMFIHFPQTDRTGHTIGWATPQQLEAIHGADNAIGTILGTLASKGLLEKTLLIISADHGGAGKTHGADDVRSRCIPWIAVGPGVRAGIDLTNSAPDRTIRTEDTFATACNFLGIPVDPAREGRPVMEIYDRRGQELLTDSSPTVAEPAPAAVAPQPAATPAPAAVVKSIETAKAEPAGPVKSPATTRPASTQPQETAAAAFLRRAVDAILR
ncbi:MAG: ectonucleotide pyrophosphatase/phosphodiesterase [Tepidisphaeraceae bacterium]